MAGLEGLDKLEGVLDDLKELVLQGAQKGLDRALLNMVGDAKANAAVDTGELREKITHTTEIDGNEVRGQLIAGAEHSVYVEFGTGQAGERTHPRELNPNVTFRADWRGQPAQPYMTPAYLANRESAKQDIADEIKQSVSKIQEG